MLFDLQSPGRRRVIKVIYAFLAILLAVGLVGFGIGSDAGGGLSEVFGGGDGGAEDQQEAFKDDVDEANEALATNPKDLEALQDLLTAYYQSGQLYIQEDQALSPDAEAALQQASATWDRYQKAAGAKVDSGTAAVAFQALSVLGDGYYAEVQEATGDDALDAIEDARVAWAKAGGAQQILAGSEVTGLLRAADLLYRGGNFKQAAAVGQEALAAATPNQRAKVTKQLEQIEQQGRKLAKDIEKFRKEIQAATQAPGAGAAPGGEPAVPDFGGTGGLGGGGLTTP